MARALGMSATVHDILQASPVAPSYATERLLLRYLIARLGIWKGSWTSLVVMSDKTAAARLRQHLETLPHRSPEAVRLNRILARRLSS
jgi:hypothetical protein